MLLYLLLLCVMRKNLSWWMDMDDVNYEMDLCFLFFPLFIFVKEKPTLLVFNSLVRCV